MSTSEQSTTPQVAMLLAAAERAGFPVRPEHIYVDDGVSGSLDSRPAFDRLLASMRAGEVSTVFVTKLDRLGRSVRGLLEFYDLADASEVRVVVTDQGIDTGTAVGRLLRTILAAVAEFERDLIVDRTQARMDALRGGMPTKSGKPVGRPKRVTDEKVAEARRLRSSIPPMKWSTVAQRVGLPAETIRKAVREASRSTPPLDASGKSAEAI
ncbi:MAG: recombinase family protein [Thermoplasmata archaeon]|nr:recombinase family protein [Thermoplasmata archaeon]